MTYETKKLILVAFISGSIILGAYLDGTPLIDLPELFKLLGQD